MPSSPQEPNEEPNREPIQEQNQTKVEENDKINEDTKQEKRKEDKKEEKEEKKESWKDIIYNPRTGEFLGRTGSSWGKTDRVRRTGPDGSGQDQVRLDY